MRLITLLSVKDLDREGPASGLAPDLRFGGQSLVEYQARQALAAGADELIIYADAASADLMQATDRLSRETDVPISLVSNASTFAQRLTGEDRVLMLGERMILPQDAIDALAEERDTTLLVTPSTAETGNFERVDATHMWAGGALLSVKTVLSTVEMIGEWDLVLTLLRFAVQQQAYRMEMPSALVSAGALVLVREQADADRALDAMAAAHAEEERARANILEIALQPLGRKLVGELARREVDPTRLNQGAGALAIAATLAITLDWSILALLLALLSGAALVLGTRGGDIAMRPPSAQWLGLLVRGAALTVLAGIGGRLAGGEALALVGVGLPLLLVALISWTATDLADMPRWATRARPSVALALVIALVCSIVSSGAIAFVLIGLLAFITVFFQMIPTSDARI
jgi:hypothetical protein